MPFLLFVSFPACSRRDRVRGSIPVPEWPSQPWFPAVAKILVNTPVLLSARENLLSLPANNAEKHRLHRKLKLIICGVSGAVFEAQDFQNKLRQPSVVRGEQPPRRAKQYTLNAGVGMQAEEIFVNFLRL